MYTRNCYNLKTDLERSDLNSTLVFLGEGLSEVVDDHVGDVVHMPATLHAGYILAKSYDSQN